MVVCIGSLVVLLVGHALVTPILMAVVSALAFLVLVYTTGDCKIPVYGGLLAMVPCMMIASKVISFGFFALGAAAGAVLAMEGQKVIFELKPELQEKLEVNQMT